MEFKRRTGSRALHWELAMVSLIPTAIGGCQASSKRPDDLRFTRCDGTVDTVSGVASLPNQESSHKRHAQATLYWISAHRTPVSADMLDILDV